MVADSSGRFEIQGMHGTELSVEVSKAGFWKIRGASGQLGSAGGFKYQSFGGSKIHVPDPQKPVVFTLFKEGNLEKLDRFDSGAVGLLENGQPSIVDVTPAGATTKREITIRAWASKNQNRDANSYDWRAEIIPRKGTIRTRVADFEFEAPDAGYEERASIEMPANVPAGIWQDVVRKSYFLRFEDGVFARVEVNLAAPPNGSVYIIGVLNPKPGSRNMEADPSIR